MPRSKKSTTTDDYLDLDEGDDAEVDATKNETQQQIVRANQTNPLKAWAKRDE